ncbi:hypothetical protein [Mycolicibacterium parafortuitum]|uniref:Integral membrane protein n=1 Tax=Mycolicibacterium parafortuitum TaxID=39692 RepID=A0A375YEB6_MYCPF|nr:hypothetical protein [Mycolicibacterium parafortuitum]ORB30205.1 hypothetical protein BST38_12050 [Mycolicibacterium parafortuitum]SRX79466.1 hypothetical protein MPP7335_01203 [Mycolicibacterium parafortuitum]
MSRFAAIAFGLLMVGAVAYRADGLAVMVAGIAATAVLASAWVRPAATAAVLLAVLTVVLGAPAPMHAVLAGLAAAVYLVVLHTDPTVPTMAFAVGFAAAAAAVVVLPVQVAWLPLAAPTALLAGYLLAVRPFTR